MLVRLQKYLAAAGIASRRESEALILSGRVKVNGHLVQILGTKIDPATDKVEVDGNPVQQEEKIYVLLNKPAGYLTSLQDPQKRPLVTDLLKGIRQRVYPVGRLDYHSEGLLLLTNDGELAHKLTHPSFKVPKTYLVTLDQSPSAKAQKQIASGIPLEEGLTAPCKVEVLKEQDVSGQTLQMIIHEGRKRQIRRMWLALGFRVIRLKRTNLGPLSLKGLVPGEYRYLTSTEVTQLKRRVGPKDCRISKNRRE